MTKKAASGTKIISDGKAVKSSGSSKSKSSKSTSSNSGYVYYAVPDIEKGTKIISDGKVAQGLPAAKRATHTERLESLAKAYEEDWRGNQNYDALNHYSTKEPFVLPTVANSESSSLTNRKAAVLPSVQEYLNAKKKKESLIDLSASRDKITELEKQLEEISKATRLAEQRKAGYRGAGTKEQIETIESEYRNLSSQERALKNEIEQLKGDLWMREQEAKYSALDSNIDFVEKSQAESRINPVYNYINNKNNSQWAYENGLVAASGIWDPLKYADMTEKEVARYNYLYNTQGRKAANEYLDYLDYSINARNRAEESEKIKQFTSSNAIAMHLANNLSFPINLVSGAGYLDALKQRAVNAIAGESDKPIDYNTNAFAPAQYTNAIRGTISDALEKRTNLEILDQNVAAFLYNTGMSIGDFMTVAAAGGGAAGSAVLASAAATSATIEAKSRGASDTQALEVGFIAGAAELVFEKLSLGNLKALQASGKGGAKNIILDILKQAGVEGSEEAATTIANTIADSLIMGDKSSINLAIAEYMNAGMSEEEATKKAYIDALKGLAMDTIGGVFSGGLTGGIFGSLSRTQSQTVQNDTPNTLPTNTVIGNMAQQPQNRENINNRVIMAANDESSFAITSETDPYAPRSFAGTPGAFNSDANQPSPVDDSSLQRRHRKVQEVADKLGVKVVFAELGTHPRTGEKVQAQYSDGNIYIDPNSDTPMLTLFKHELAHHIETSAFYNDFVDAAAKIMKSRGVDIEAQSARLAKEWGLDKREAKHEIIALFAQDNLFTDQDSINRLAESNRNVADRIWNWLRDQIRKIGKSQEIKDLIHAEEMFRKALQAAKENGSRNTRYYLNPEFVQEYDDWDGRDPTRKFEIGTTSKALQSIGVKEQRILWDSSKILKIKSKHPQMTDTIIKQVPNIIENPILVMQSQQSNSRIVMFGEVFDNNGTPVLAVLELKPTGQRGLVLDLIKVASAYGKDRNPQRLIDTSRLLYVDPNKNRTDAWLTSTGLQLPVAVTKYGSINKLSYFDMPVNSRIRKDESENAPDHNSASAKVLPITKYFSDQSWENIQGLPQAEKKSAEILPQAEKQSAKILPQAITYDEAVEKYGAIPPGENASRDIQVPQRVSDKKKTRRFIRTIMESDVLTDEMVEGEKDQILKNGHSYVPISDESAMNKADSMMEASNQAKAWKEWEAVRNGKKKATKENIAVGERLLQLAAENNDATEVIRLSCELAAEFTRAGQVVQAARLLKKMGPVGDVYYIKRATAKINRDLAEQFSKNRYEVEPNEDYIGELLAAKTEKERQAAMDMITVDIAEQIPSSWIDKLNAWRYIAMLGNPRTHIRNIVGNAVFYPAVRLKDFVATGIEKAIVKEGKRSKAIKVDQKYKDFAKSDYPKVEADLTGNGKNNPADMINDKRRIYKSRALEDIRRFLTNTLEKEDSWFLKAHYVAAMSQYLQANKIDVNTLTEDSDILQKARKYAILEAQKGTYRDASAAADWLSKIAKPGDSAGSKVKSFLIEGVIPFKKTPVNILRRGIEYSPVGLIKQLTWGTRQLKNGKISASEFVDGVASGLTGSAVMGVGAMLSALGLVVGTLGDDDEKAIKEMTGEQEYALRIGDASYTIDWAAPLSMPFFVGVEIMSAIKAEHEELQFKDLIDIISHIGEPVFNLTMLSGLNGLLESISFSEHKIPSALGQAASSYLQQFFPSISGQLARTIDGTRRSTYVDKNSGVPHGIQRFGQQVMGKIPGLTFAKNPYIDEWGQQEREGIVERLLGNFASPGYYSKINVNDVEKEIMNLYGSTGSDVVIPGTASKYFTANGERYDMTADEYVQYATTLGNTRYDVLDSIIDHMEYQKLTEEEKLACFEYTYEYAKQYAKLEIGNVGMDAWQESIYKASKNDSGELAAHIIDKVKEDTLKKEKSAAMVLLKEAVSSYSAKEAADLVAELKSKGKTQSAIRSSITSLMKPEYIAASESGDTATMRKIADTLKALDLDYDDKDLEKWLK